jgi:hypothetical protein
MASDYPVIDIDAVEPLESRAFSVRAELQDWERSRRDNGYETRLLDNAISVIGDLLKERIEMQKALQPKGLTP